MCADLYFASVGTLKELKQIGLRFIGVVKTATQQFPQSYLANLEMRVWGKRREVITRDENSAPLMLAFCWMDQDRRNFISSTLSLQPGRAYSRFHWQQVSKEPNAAPMRVKLNIFNNRLLSSTTLLVEWSNGTLGANKMICSLRESWGPLTGQCGSIQLCWEST